MLNRLNGMAKRTIFRLFILFLIGFHGHAFNIRVKVNRDRLILLKILWLLKEPGFVMSLTWSVLI